MPQPLDSRYPTPIQPFWAELHYDVVSLHGRWIVYRQLFGTNEQRVELLNELAGTVSWMLQTLLLHDIQLSISKISDPPASGVKKNLSVRRLQKELLNVGETALAKRMEPLLLQLEISCSKIRDRRNKWIAHNDLETKLGARAIPLLGPSRVEIEVALESLRKVMNCVGYHFTNTETLYEEFIMQNDGNHLLTALTRAKRYQMLMKEGVIPRNDLRINYPEGI